jgi:hypothetical protein
MEEAMETAVDAKVSDKHLTREELEEYVAVDRERKELERRASALKKRQDLLKTRFLAVIGAKGDTAISYKRCGFIVMVKEGNRYPSWADEFLRVAGVDAVEEVKRRTEPAKVLVVEPCQ